MAQLYSTGPCYMYLAGYSALEGATAFNHDQGKYLGTAKFAPLIDVTPIWKDIPNDAAGRGVTYDLAYLGQEGFVSAELTRWNAKLYEKVAQRTANLLADNGSVPGLDRLDDLGTLVMTEGRHLCLWLVFPYAKFHAYQNQQNGPLANGYRFPASVLKGPDRHAPGTGAYSLTVNWHCVRSPNGSGDLLLYDHDTANLPTPD